MQIILAVHMRYHLFLHCGWFLQNLRKDFIPTNMHTTVANLLKEAVKKSPNQETGLGNKGRLKVLNDTKLILND